MSLTRLSRLYMHDSSNPHNHCDGSFTHDSLGSPNPGLHALYNPLPWLWAGLEDLTSIAENTQKWCGVTSEMRLQTTRTCLPGTLFISRPLTWSLWWTKQTRCELPYAEVRVARGQGKSPANSLGVTGTCNSDPTTLRNWILIIPSWVSLEASALK